MTADAFAQRLNRHSARIRHLPAPLARALSHVVPGLPAGLVDVMVHDTIGSGGSGETARVFGVRLHALEEVWG